MSDVGQAISRSFKFVSQVGQECEALANLIKTEIKALFGLAPLKDRYHTENWLDDYYTQGWIYTDMAWSLPIAPIGESNVAYLSFQISLLCSDAEAGSCPEPLLHINFWDSAVNFRDQEFMGFPMGGLSSELRPSLQDGTARLLRWDEDGHPKWWTYTVRLAKVNSLEDVRTLIITPVEHLLDDIEAGEKMLEEVSAVVCYKSAEEPEYYQVIL